MKTPTRITALLLAAVLTLSVLGTGILTASAAETYEQTDSYVLDYNGTYTGAKWQYFSPYVPLFKFEGATYDTTSIIFTLYDTVNQETIPVYCTDVRTGLDNGADYRRINLEDSTYAGNAAGLLRSIVLKGYPNTGTDALGAAAGVEDLTVGEAVAATQAAIWQSAHGSVLEFTDFSSYIDTQWNSSATANFDLCYAEIESGYAASENEALIEAHIEAVFNYLVSLEPTAPAGVVASQSSFVDYDITLTANEDGTYTITATATVDVVIDDAGDSLTLTALAGEYTASTALSDGKNQYTLTISNVPADVADDGVTLAIDGVQSAEDVYLFDAAGERGTSQSLIGITDNALPVHVEVTSNDRILNIHKYSPVAGDDISVKTPLANVVFNIYYVCALEDYVNGRLGLSAVPTAEEIAKYAVDSNLVAVVVTDENGLASWNFGAVDGVYMVVEQESNTVVSSLADPFYVPVANVDSEGNMDYIVDVYPKNDVVSEDVKIEKDVTEIDNDHDTYDVDQLHTWIIQSSIPAGMASGIKYEISDTLDYRLTYKGNLAVTVAKTTDPAKTETVYLTEGTDYTVTLTAGVDEDGNAVDKFVVSLTAAGMRKVAETAAEDFSAYEVRVYFDAVIDSDAQLGVQIPNQAHIDYTNAVGQDFDADSDIPEVHTGGLNLLKVDAADETKTLAGAAFRIAREAAEGETPDAVITVDGREINVVYVGFYDNAELSGEKVTSVTTGEDGTAIFYGLAYGTYYLVETNAPAGYNKLTQPVAVEVTAASHLDDSRVTVKNSAGFELPSTGGMGTTLFTVAGLLLILGSGTALVVRRRLSAE